MLPDSTGRGVGSSAVVTALFFALAIASYANLILSRFPTYIIIAVASTLRGVGYACSTAELRHPSRQLHIAFQTLESMGYGASIEVLFKTMGDWLKTPHNPRPPHPKLLEWLCHLLMVVTITLSIILSPIGFTMLYDTDNKEANFHGRKIDMTVFWGRLAVLIVWTILVTLICAYSFKGYHKDRKKPHHEDATGTFQRPSAKDILHANCWQRVDTRLLIFVILLCTLLQDIASCFYVVVLYHKNWEEDIYFMLGVILPQLLEAALLNIPGLLPRLASSSSSDKEFPNDEESPGNNNMDSPSGEEVKGEEPVSQSMACSPAT
ncbi:g2764 [Coccomyxa elongata]